MSSRTSRAASLRAWFTVAFALAALMVLLPAVARAGVVPTDKGPVRGTETGMPGTETEQWHNSMRWLRQSASGMRGADAASRAGLATK